MPSWIIGWGIFVIIACSLGTFITIWIKLEHQSKGRMKSWADRRHEITLQKLKYAQDLELAKVKAQVDIAKASSIDWLPNLDQEARK